MPLTDDPTQLLHLAAAPPRPKLHVQPLGVWVFDNELRCNVRHPRGYRFVCSAHGAGPRRATWAAAREDLQAHKRTCGQ